VTPPAGYAWLADGPRRAVIRDDLVGVFAPWLLAPELAPPAGAERLGTGRGAAYRVHIAGAPPAVVRIGRRGGAVGRLVRETYLGVRPRPWRELAVSLAARRNGAPVPEVLAVRVDGWMAYRSAIVTAEIPDARTAIEALRGAEPDARVRIARAAGVAVARLHDAGVQHADLNLTNILVGAGGGTIVDLDRARVVPGSLGGGARRRNLARLCRSAKKLDPSGELIDRQTREAFDRAYGTPAGATCGS